MHAITLYEWENRNSEAGSLFTQFELRQLERFNDAFKRKTDADVIRVTPRGRIDTYSYVGIIQIGHKRIEILPKLHDPEKQTDLSEIDKKDLKFQARKNLLQMLAFSGTNDIQKDGTAEYAKENVDLFEFLVKIFLDDLERALAAHIHREYVVCDAPLYTIRGRINLKCEMVKTPSQRGQIFCLFDELSADNILNKVIKATLNKISRLSSSDENRQRCRMYAQLLDEVEDIVIRRGTFSKMQFTRLNRPYQRIINFCKLVWSDLSYIGDDDGEPFSAILFDMNMVFEAYISKMLRRDLLEYTISFQEPINIASALNEQKRDCKIIYPDICIKKQNKRLLVVDAKYKLDLDAGYIKASDFYQMIAYAIAAEVDAALLLYPRKLGQNDITKKEYTVHLEKIGSGESEGRKIDILAMPVTIFDASRNKNLIKSFKSESNRAIFERINHYIS